MRIELASILSPKLEIKPDDYKIKKIEINNSYAEAIDASYQT